MLRYRHPTADAGVTAFRLGRQSITIQFQDGGIYLYNHRRPGLNHVETMKKLAKQGRGLTTYINQHVRSNFARKLR